MTFINDTNKNAHDFINVLKKNHNFVGNTSFEVVDGERVKVSSVNNKSGVWTFLYCSFKEFHDILSILYGTNTKR